MISQKTINLTFILIFFSSCGTNIEKNIKSDSLSNLLYKDSVEKSINNENFKTLKEKYNAYNIEDDTIKYSFEIDEILSKTNRPLIINGKIIDIYKSNSDYFVLLSYVYFKHKINSAKVKINEQIFNKLKDELFKFKEMKLPFVTFIINECKFIPAIPKLVAENNSEDDAILNYNYKTMITIIEGNAIDYSIEK